MRMANLVTQKSNMENPRIFVTTYAAYSEGKQFVNGQYVDIDATIGYEAFCKRCKAATKETDPEFMVTDFEGFPRVWYSECGLPSEEMYDIICGYILCDDPDMVNAFLSCTSESFDSWSELENTMNDQFIGRYKSDIDYADSLACELGYFDAMEKAGIDPSYFDTERFLNDLQCGSEFASCNGYYFDLNR